MYELEEVVTELVRKGNGDQDPTRRKDKADPHPLHAIDEEIHLRLLEEYYARDYFALTHW